MYHVDQAAPPASLSMPPPASTWRQVNRNVWALGFTSLFTDVSSEMITSVLPLYLVVHLGLTPLAFGVVDGLYQGFSALLRVASGVLADRWGRYKELAALGYGVSGLCRLGLVAAGASWPALAAVVVIDRTAKGIRTAPRDALISLSSPARDLGLSFGLHRSMDAAGAMLGPIVAFALLARVPDGFDAVFVASFSVAAIGFAVLLLFVSNVTPGPRPGGSAAPSIRSAVRLAALPGFRSILIAGTGLACVTISDAFVYLALQRQLELRAGMFPLLFVGTAFFYFGCSAPLGRLADRWGRARVFLGGYLLLALVYGALLTGSLGMAGALACLALMGAYYAATDGVLMALASGVLPPGSRGAGLALATTSINLGKLAASMLFGVAWTILGLQGAVLAFGGCLLCMVALAARVLPAGGHGTAP